jgi:hypothetical protein
MLCVVLIFIIDVRHSRTELVLCFPLGALRCSGACAVLIFSFPGCPWLCLAVPGLLLAAPNCSWLLHVYFMLTRIMLVLIVINVWSLCFLLTKQIKSKH